MPDVAEQQRNGLAQDAARRRALEKSVVLLAPSFGWYRGQYQLPKAKTAVEVNGKEVAQSSVTTPCSKLMTDTYPVDADGVAWKRRLQKIESRQKSLIEKYSVPFPIRGVRIVPKAAARAFFRELDDVKRDLQTAADEFVANLDGIVRQMKEKTAKEVFDTVEHKIPKLRNVMRAKFFIDVVPVEIAGSEDRPNVLTRDDLDQHYEMVQEACRRKVEEAVEMMIEKPREQLAGALAGLKNVIDRNGKVTQKSFNPVYDAMRKLRAFSFVANEELLLEINNLERRMRGTTPMTLDQVSSANCGFTAALDTLLTEVEDAEQQASDLEEFGREHRAIDLT